ncbi:MAG: hypothetical protein ACKOWX_07320 [Flavobacteriales bacterium]
MQQFLVGLVVVGALIYLVKYVHQLFFAAQTPCKGCGLTPKNNHESHA